MRVFLDTNVWASAFGSRGVCQDLVMLLLAHQESSRLRMFSCAQVGAETLRVLQLKFRVDSVALDAAQQAMAFAELDVSEAVPAMPADFPDADDWPILCAAAHARADWFVTGDKALLALGTFEAMPILDPRTAYLRLRGLD